MAKTRNLKENNKLDIHEMLTFYTNVITLSKTKSNDQEFGAEVRKLCKDKH